MGNGERRKGNGEGRKGNGEWRREELGDERRRFFTEKREQKNQMEECIAPIDASRKRVALSFEGSKSMEGH